MRKIALFLAGLLVSTSAFAADSQLLNLVMPDAKVIGGVNVTAAKISPMGQYVLTQITAQGGEDLNEFITETGFDPRQDVTEILVASAGNQQQGLVLARGTFDVAKISAMLSKDAKQQTQQYGGASLIVFAVNDKPSHAVAFLGDSIAIAGDVSSVKAAIDRSTGANSINPALATRVQQLSTTQDAWTVTLSSLSSLMPGLGIWGGTGNPAPGNTAGSTAGREPAHRDPSNRQATPGSGPRGRDPHGDSPSASGRIEAGPGAATFQLVKDIQESSGGVKFGANIEITAQVVTSDPKNATALGDMIRMLAGLAMLVKGPEATSMAGLLQTLQVTATGTTVNIGLSIPEAQAESLLKPPAARAQKL